MNYYLGMLTLDPKRWHPIDSSRYETIREHKANLLYALEIEERFDILLGNYIEFEEDILKMALRHVVIRKQEPNDWNTQRREMNRRIANFLSSAILYRDHLKHHIRSIFGEGSPQEIGIEKEISFHYDSSFSYRLMEAIRNYVQHRGVAVPSISVMFQLTKLQPGAQVACTVTPQMMKKYLLADPKFKASVQQEIEALPDTTDLKPQIREYMTRLNLLNNWVRSLLNDECSTWEKTIRNTIEEFKERYSLTNDIDTLGLAIFKCEAEAPSSDYEKHDIFIDFIEYRKHLIDTNMVAEKLMNSFATGQQKDLMKTK